MFKRNDEEKPEDENPMTITPPVEAPKPEPEPSEKKGNVRIIREEGPLGVKTYEYRE